MDELAHDDHRYHRSKSDRVLGGVCGGLADYLDLDPLLVRVVWVGVTVATFALGAVVYLLLWLLAPEQ